MNITRLLMVFLMVVALLTSAGCRTVTAETDVPALIIQPNESSRAALNLTLSELFGGQIVKLSDDVFTRSSLLILETGLNDTLKTPAVSGRILSAPYKLHLVKNGDACILIDMRDGSRHLLVNTLCIPE